ncbi:YybS family protein [Halobiforma nitratireducens]|uniref:DUF456 domain-containing protein n=1 Tax=Halobiforma nitratireducens JCM 10879 TaxID=1227454 RepID=M0LAF6_9EURY|nr:hypothetical protein [Halobiforma nitratireducens]EMA30551.1 hypothetical protein C446_16617 [Halobiforma nitratireducens JCM 10879]
MSDRSDELTESRDRESDRERDPGSTDDLLEETERLLEETGPGTDDTPGSASSPVSDPGSEPGPDLDSDFDSIAESGTHVGPDVDPNTETGSRPTSSEPSEPDSSLRSRLSPRRFLPTLSLPGSVSVPREDLFSPKAFLVFVLLIGAGLLAGGTILPVAGRIVGMFAVAFLVGLLTSKRRYFEMATAGVLSSGAVTLVADPLLAVAGNMQLLLAVGATTGLAATVIGYYFGRDLRAGLARDVD